jgi:AcrR family transcriptional regulator
MNETHPNKHELKTRETRELLLRAAETVFVRDGYEGAELSEIAALAGRTKGAIYAQFESKADVFLALIDDRRRRLQEEAATLLSESTSIEGNRAAIRGFYQRQVDDQSWSMLLLEFKLFAIRHPESKKRLEELYQQLLSSKDEARIAGILGRAAESEDAISRVAAAQTMQPLLCALALESRFDDITMDAETMKRVVGRVFDALFAGA